VKFASKKLIHPRDYLSRHAAVACLSAQKSACADDNGGRRVTAIAYQQGPHMSSVAAELGFYQAQLGKIPQYLITAGMKETDHQLYWLAAQKCLKARWAHIC